MKLKTMIKTIMFITFLLWPLLSSPVVHAEASPQFVLTTDTETLQVGEPMTLTMKGKNINDLYAYEVKFTYDSNKLELKGATTTLEGFTVSPIKKHNEITFAHTKVGKVAGESGDFTIGTVTLIAKSAGSSQVKWDSLKLVDHNLASQTFSIGNIISVTIENTHLIDIQNHWAQQWIQEAVQKGIINGFPDGSFRPDDSITRAQFAAILVRALNLKDEASLTFTDLNTIPDWAKSVVAKAVKAGIINGYEDQSFRADQFVTRSEIAVMVARAAKLESVDPKSLSFADKDEIPGWAQGSIAAAVQKGMIEGRDHNMFAPNAGATRAEATVLVLRMLK